MQWTKYTHKIEKPSNVPDIWNNLPDEIKQAMKYLAKKYTICLVYIWIHVAAVSKKPKTFIDRVHCQNLYILLNKKYYV